MDFCAKGSVNFSLLRYFATIPKEFVAFYRDHYLQINQCKGFSLSLSRPFIVSQNNV